MQIYSLKVKVGLSQVIRNFRKERTLIVDAQSDHFVLITSRMGDIYGNKRVFVSG